MTTVDMLTIGWLDASIGAVIRNEPALLSRFAYALVTSVDSAIDLPGTAIGRAIVERHPECGFLGKGLVIPSAKLANISEEFDLFHGFDEVWCFDKKPDVAKPPDFWIVSPLNLSSDAAPPQLLAWMKQSACLLGLGDGIGLNYATTDAETRRFLGRLAASSRRLPAP